MTRKILLSLTLLLFSMDLISPSPVLAEATKSPASATPSPSSGEVESAHRDEAIQLLRKASTAGFAIQGVGDQMEALRRLAVAQAVVGDSDGYRASIQKIKEIADGLISKQKEEGQKAETLQQVSFTEVQAGDLVSARKTADAITVLEKRNKALKEIGETQAKAGHRTAALATADAIHNSKTYIDDYTKAAVILAVALAEARDGSVGHGWKILERVTDYETRVWIFGAFAKAQAKWGDFEGALATINLLPAKGSRAQTARDEAQNAVAQAQARADHLDAAMTTAAKISDRREKEKALIEIGKVQAGKGDLAAAAATAEQISKGDDRDAVRVEIIRAKARARDFDAALADAREISYESTKTKAFTAIAVAQCEAGKSDAALATLESLHSEGAAYAYIELALAAQEKDPGFVPKAMEKARLSVHASGSLQKEWDSDLYYLLARTYALLGDFDPAMSAAEDCSDWRKQNAYEFIAVERAAAKGFPEAVQWSEKLADAFARCVTLTALAEERVQPARPAKEKK